MQQLEDPANSVSSRTLLRSARQAGARKAERVNTGLDCLATLSLKVMGQTIAHTLYVMQGLQTDEVRDHQ